MQAELIAIPDRNGRIEWREYLCSLVGRGWSRRGIAETANVSRGTVLNLMTKEGAEPLYSAGVRLMLLQSREPVNADSRRAAE